MHAGPGRSAPSRVELMAELRVLCVPRSSFPAAHTPSLLFPCLPPHSLPLLQDNFYVVDLGALQRLYRAWGEAMPRVHPYYAVKCNPDVGVLATLAALGAGFDCASEAEIRAVGRASEQGRVGSG